MACHDGSIPKEDKKEIVIKKLSPEEIRKYLEEGEKLAKAVRAMIEPTLGLDPDDNTLY